MGKLLDMLVGAEETVRSRLGLWRQAISRDVDSNTASISGGGVSVTGGFEYFANPPTNVNSATGNDGNDGLTSATALQSITELGRRFENRTLLPTATAVDIALAGSFADQKLILNFVSPGLTTITISGQMSTVFSGSIDVYTTKNATTNTRPAITDATANFPNLIRRRIRSTSGAVNGALTWVMPSAGTGATNGNIGQFTGLTVGVSPSFATQNPVAGTTYSVEDFVTQILAYDVTVPGRGTVTIRDIDFAAPTAGQQQRSFMRVNGAPTNGRLFGCRVSGPGQHTFEGNHEHGALGFMNNLGALTYQFFIGRVLDNCHFNSNTNYINGSQFLGQGCMHDGGGAGLCNLNVNNGAVLEDLTDRSFFGSSGALDALVTCDDGGKYILSAAGSILWGGVAPNALNVATQAARIRSDSSLTWITLPTLIGSVAGNDVINGGVLFAWAGVAAGVNNANNGAIAAPRA
jgi:hypothetical protein